MTGLLKTENLIDFSEDFLLNSPTPKNRESKYLPLLLGDIEKIWQSMQGVGRDALAGVICIGRDCLG